MLPPETRKARAKVLNGPGAKVPGARFKKMGDTVVFSRDLEVCGSPSWCQLLTHRTPVDGYGDGRRCGSWQFGYQQTDEPLCFLPTYLTLAYRHPIAEDCLTGGFPHKKRLVGGHAAAVSDRC